MATQREKQQIRWAIQELMKDAGDFTGAIGVLATIAGLRYLAAEMDRSDGVPLTNLPHEKDSTEG